MSGSRFRAHGSSTEGGSSGRTGASPSRPAERLIRAYKHGWPRAAVSGMIFRKTRKAFFRVRTQGLGRLRAAIDADPRGLVLAANHSCWWDVFLAHVLNDSIPVDGHGMMEWFNLKRFGFFRRIGAYSVDRTDPLSVRASLDYTLELLERPRSSVWIFPQGRMTSNDVRPLGFQGGLRALLRRGGSLRLATVALRYEYWQDERPEAFVRFGEPEVVGRERLDGFLDQWEHRLTTELDALKADVASQAQERFETLIEGTPSISDRFGRLHARAFGRTPGAPPLAPGDAQC
jgi:1-acyl-sn-glycerol-3-phosphate acyltransferase